MSINKLLGLRLKALRERAKLTQEELAELANVQPQTITYIETGRRFVSGDSADKIAKALKISYSELFNFEEPALNEDRLAPLLPYLNRLSDEDLEFFLASIKAFIKTRKN